MVSTPHTSQVNVNFMSDWNLVFHPVRDIIFTGMYTVHCSQNVKQSWMLNCFMFTLLLLSSIVKAWCKIVLLLIAYILIPSLFLYIINIWCKYDKLHKKWVKRCMLQAELVTIVSQGTTHKLYPIHRTRWSDRHSICARRRKFDFDRVNYATGW